MLSAALLSTVLAAATVLAAPGGPLTFSMAVPPKSLKQCPRIAPRAGGPSSVYDLRVDEVKVFGALGDSISAGFGVTPDLKDPLRLLHEQRGLSWTTGSDDDAVSLFNFIKTFQPELVGGSVGEHLVELCYGVLCPPFQYRNDKDVLNAAQSGALAANLPSQATHLVKQMKKRRDINFTKDYKVVTLLIGANDLCLSCASILTGGFTSPSAFESSVRKAIETIRKEIPRVVISAAELFNVSAVYDLSLKSDYCTTVHRLTPIECACAFTEGPVGRATRQKMDEIAQQYNARLRKIADSYANDLTRKDRDSFAMVVQPVGRDSSLVDLPIEFLSKLDCFHPSRIGQSELAVALWNNLITPIGKKRTRLMPGEEPECPTAETRIYA